MVARSIAAAQTVPARGDVGANIEHHGALVHAAAETQARVLVFPELSLTGYELDLADELAFSENDPRLGPLVDLSSSYEMTLIVGAPVRLGARLHIGAFILSGGTIDLYTKHHLGAFGASAGIDGVVPPAEATVFDPGERNPLVAIGDRTAAVAICADTGRPSHPKNAADRGASTYLASMFIIPSDLDKDREALRSYAARHRMAVVLANFGGPSGGLRSAGCSTIWSEQGELLVQLGSTSVGVAVAIETDDGWRAETLELGSAHAP